MYGRCRGALLAEGGVSITAARAYLQPAQARLALANLRTDNEFASLSISAV